MCTVAKVYTSLSTAVPNLSGDQIMHKVDLPDSESAVSTVLECGIEPGALVQRYSVQWLQISPTLTVQIDDSMFNLSLSINSSANGTLYRCEVTVDHDSNISIPYTGGYIIIIAEGWLVYSTNRLP